MGISKRIEVVIDVVTDAARTSLHSFRSSISEAEGVTGKFRAATTGAFNMARENAGQLALIGGAALATFAVKAVGAFEDTAKSALDLSKATGLSTEEASRWIGVGDDYLVSAGTLTTALSRMNKTLDSDKWAKYGIATHDASGNLRSTNDVLVDSLAKLSSIKDAHEQSAAGLALFGKGWAALAPLLGHTRDEYVKMLGSVEAGQVITDKEAATAEKMRLAQDKLNDALKEVTLAVGQQIAKLAPLIEATAGAIGKVIEFKDALGDTSTALGKAGTLLEFQVNPVGKFGDVMDIAKGKADGVTFAIGDGLAGALKKSNETMGKATPLTDAFGNALADVEPKLYGDIKALAGHMTATEFAALATARLEYETKKAAEGVTKAAKANAEHEKALKDETDALKNAAAAELDLISAYRSAADATYAVRDATDKYNADLATLDENITAAKGNQAEIAALYRAGTVDAAGIADATARVYEETAKANGTTITAAQKQDIWNQSMLTSAATATGPMRQSIIDYIAQVNGIPTDVATYIKALMDQGKVDEANKVLADVSKTRTAAVIADADTSEAERRLRALTDHNRFVNVIANFINPGTPVPNPKGYASGTSSATAGMHLVGEQGPELVNLNAGDTVTTADKTAALLGGSVVNNFAINTGADPRSVITIVKQYLKNGGQL